MPGFVDSEEANLVCSAMCDTFKGLCKLRRAHQGLEKHVVDADGPELREVSGRIFAPFGGAVILVYLELYTLHRCCNVSLILTSSSWAKWSRRLDGSRPRGTAFLLGHLSRTDRPIGFGMW